MLQSIIYLNSADDRKKYGVTPAVCVISLGLSGYHSLKAAGYSVIYSGNGRLFWGLRK